MSSASETNNWTEITKPKAKKIVFNLTNWSIKGKETSDVRVNIKAWLPKTDHLKFQENNTLKVFATGRYNTGTGVQKAFKEIFYEYLFPLDGVTITRANFTDLGWSFDCNGETIVLDSSLDHRILTFQFKIKKLSKELSMRLILFKRTFHYRN